MDFYAILDQVIDLLHQRQRVTYRALKVQFKLDDEALKALQDTVVISQGTWQLIHGYFVWEVLGAQDLKGLAQPLMAYQVLRESAAQTRLDVAAMRGLTPLVGREAEVKVLLEHWAQVKEGTGHVIVLSGEPGLGKSRLVHVLQEQVAAEPHTRWECRGLPYYHNTALYPLVDLVQRLLHWHPDDTPQEKLHKLETTVAQYRFPLAEMVPLVALLVALTLSDDRYPLLRLSPQRQKMLEILLTWLCAEAERQPVLFEVLEHLVVKTDGVPLFVEELPKMVLEAGFLHAVHDHYELTRVPPPVAIPASLHDALMARLDRLAIVKGVAQLGAVLGRHFPYALLQVVADLDEITLQRALEQLVAAELLYRPRPPTSLSTCSSRIPPINRSCGVSASSTISGPCRYSQSSFRRSPRPNPNCWYSMTPRQVSVSRPCAPGSRRAWQGSGLVRSTLGRSSATISSKRRRLACRFTKHPRAPCTG